MGSRILHGILIHIIFKTVTLVELNIYNIYLACLANEQAKLTNIKFPVFSYGIE